MELIILRPMSMNSQVQERDRNILSVTHKRIFLLAGSTFVLFIAFNRIFQAMLLAEQRKGMVLWDPVHAILPAPIDLSLWIFAATYSVIILSIVILFLESMERLAFAFSVASVLIFLRSVSFVLFPLDPPPGMIPLIDPAIAYFNPGQFVATRDLFFSGHCATMFFLYWVARPIWLRRLMIAVNIFVIFAISIQRVHYTIDIIGGILASWGVAVLMDYLFRKFNLMPITE